MLFRTFVCSVVLAVPASAPAYPGGTPQYVTDIAPFCASCHSSTSGSQLAGAPENRIQAELAETKHIAKILAAKPNGPYAELTEEQRSALIEGVRRIDAGSSVQLVAPDKIAPGQVFEATVEARGGGGPVVGIALVDASHRWQARPAASAGWRVLETPSVTGPDGEAQTRFTDGRRPDLGPGISYVNVYGIDNDPASESFARVTVRFRLKAPPEVGTYPLAAVFLYGTEKASPYGAVEQIQGRSPRGGFGGAGGRVRFSDVLSIRVE